MSSVHTQVTSANLAAQGSHDPAYGGTHQMFPWSAWSWKTVKGVVPGKQ